MGSITRGPLVELEHTDVRIAGATVLRRIDWQLVAGTHWGVVGPNGSGKSTFLRLVAGTAWPAPGSGTRRYDFGNGVRTDAIEARRKIALVGPELQNLYAKWDWNFTAEEVVLSGIFRTDIPRRRPSTADKIRAHAHLYRVELTHLNTRRFLELSRGEQRRVLIARAMAFHPEVLLLDEPASGLDQRAREHVDALIAAIGASTTVVCSGHHASDLPSITTDVLFLESGRIVPAPVVPAAPAAPVAMRHSPRSLPDSGPTRTATALIDIERADVWLRGRRVLDDVSWRLADGEHWLVTGANGSGKSTFLKLLHGQLRPALGGRISWPALGNPRNVWQLRRQIGYVSAELHADYRYPATVQQCIASGIESSIGLTRALTGGELERVEELLDRFELAALASRPLTSLSYGQMHRVLLARTLINEPRIVLLDEPWEGLDRATRALVSRQIETAAVAGAQIVCASHIVDGGLQFTDLLRIVDGRVRGEKLAINADARAALREN